MPPITYCRNGHHNGQPIRRPHSWHQVLAADLYAENNPITQFCTKCGAGNISDCPNCNEPLTERREFERPNHCGHCGQPFPWTETALVAAKEYADELEDLSLEDRTTLKGAIGDITSDTPRTELAASRIKRLIAKVGPTAGDVLKKVIIELATEAARKSMGM